MNVNVRRVNYLDAADRSALLRLLDQYAQDPMGGGVPLAPSVQARLCDDLARQPGAVSFIAWQGQTAVGLINCFTGYSTFKAQPLLNVHDIAVAPECRGQGVGQALLAAAEAHAHLNGCCKLTLEVLSGNTVAQRSYARFGFSPYQLDPGAGGALLLQKWL
jgi:ribosomal protein S18 acetylase RimI-like enzyme